MSALITPFRASLYVAHLQRINFTGREKKTFYEQWRMEILEPLQK